MNDLWRYNISSGQWTWMSGSNMSARWARMARWVRLLRPTFLGREIVLSAGPMRLEISGSSEGLVSIRPGHPAILNDLWMYSISSGQWTWMSGSNVVNQIGTYGTLGTPAPANVPGARDSDVSWTDMSGNLWLFGGHGFDSAGGPPVG